MKKEVQMSYDPLEYIRKYYEVPATKGRVVVYKGKMGTIVGASGPHVKVLLDEAKFASPYHPTDLDYDIPNINNTELLNVLMMMCNQHCSTDGVVCNHDFISCDEIAMNILCKAGVAIKIGGDKFKLLWDELKKLK